jgi:hypothetical protein
MAKSESTHTLKFKSDLSDLLTDVNGFKSKLNTFMQSGNAPKGLEKAFDKINDLMGQVIDKAGKPLNMKGLTKVGKDLDLVSDNFSAILRLLGNFDDLSDDLKLTFASDAERQKIAKIADALKSYGQSAAEAKKKLKELEAANKQLDKDRVRQNKAQKDYNTAIGKQNSKKTELSTVKKQKKLAIANGADV